MRRPVASLTDGDPHGRSLLVEALAADPHVAHADIETFAQVRLDSWIPQFRSSSSASVSLGNCISAYIKTAREQSKGKPEDEALVMLTVLKLWAALDQLAIAQHPILADYSPESPLSLLEPLLLRSSLSLRGLVNLRGYLGARHERASVGSVFSDEITPVPTSFHHVDAHILLQLPPDSGRRPPHTTTLSAQDTRYPHRRLLTFSRTL
ncbi:hypothetical protein DXG03_006746 [Asterophora parasitica]|uniref:Uncharacterized protein n=1 Tax=Asterophora parasitica TaxID=117018 RepID=A0A9P7G5I7_9AGAR|nr:hypothetical protein DXG03_006746 [Asterophora parasitica]